MRAFSWRISSACSAFLVLRFSLSQARKDCPPSEIKAGAKVRTMSAAFTAPGWGSLRAVYLRATKKRQLRELNAHPPESTVRRSTP